ncbi:glycosyltransferase family 4 protein [Yoonia sp. R2331]|uniref:glycosyltransferase family 4 protein n=1 Tax=Yoonia sp. R2331 TaxID=3237238 RepID=UPI0034E406DC
MTRPMKVVHLVDDTTAGGITRVVDFILSGNGRQTEIQHERQVASRGKLNATRYEADVIVSHLTFSWRNLPALILLRASNAGKPMIHVEHSYTEGFVAHNVTHQRRFLTLLRTGFSLFDQIVSVSYAQADWFSAKNLCARSKVSTIQSCVDLAPFRSIPATDGPVRIFGAIGRLDRQKGFDALIAAFKTCEARDIELHIFGEGEEEENLRQLAAGDQRIVFKGFAASPTEAFANIDAVVMPSRWEAYGLVAIEAISAGKLLICSNVDGLQDHEPLGAEFLEQYSKNCIACKILQVRSRAGSPLNELNAKSIILEETFFLKWRQLLCANSHFWTSESGDKGLMAGRT